MRPPLEYRPIPGFPGYEIGTDGVVLSYWAGSHLHRYIDPERWTAVPMSLNNGYPSVNLRHPEGKRFVRVHRLVALVFIPNPQNLPVVRHLNHDTWNNGVENLAWGTHQDNMDDRRTNGTHGFRAGRITAADQRRIHELRAAGLSYRAIAKQVGTSSSTVLRVVRGLTWRSPLTPREVEHQARKAALADKREAERAAS